MKNAHRLIALLLTLVSFAVYILTVAPDVLPGDSGWKRSGVPLEWHAMHRA